MATGKLQSPPFGGTAVEAGRHYNLCHTMGKRYNVTVNCACCLENRSWYDKHERIGNVRDASMKNYGEGDY